MTQAQAQAAIEFIHTPAGVVAGHIIRRPGAKYRISHAQYIGPEQAGGRHIVTCSAPRAVGFRLAWPYGATGQAEYREGVTHYGLAHEHVLTAKFYPPNLGPYAVYIDDGSGQPASDILGSIGLLGGDHVSYTVAFALAGQGITYPIPADAEGLTLLDPGQQITLTQIDLRLGRIEQQLTRLVGDL